MESTMSDLLIKKSSIHGKGVFVNRTFKKDEVVIVWDTSHTVSKEDISKFPEVIRKNVYLYNGNYIVPSSPGKYLNHSCDANTYARDGRDYAKRDIQKGEEITIDMSSEPILGLPMKCRCGSKNCKKVIRSNVFRC